MDSSTFFSNSMSNQEENDNGGASTPENSSDSPPRCASFNDYSKITTTSTSSPKKSARRAIQKRVVSIPIKGDNNSNTPPPSDSWAWRKYGQKPIKGSPYPRGYYRCSSSKGCPARKQVERSRVDPTMLVITYSAEHNHPWPASRNHHHHHNNNNNTPNSTSSAAAIKPSATKTEESPEPQQPDHQDPDTRFADLNDEFGWFADMETTSSTVLESPIFSDGGADSADVARMVFPMGEEDESLFADLGELPECSLVFRHRGVGPQVQIC